MHTERVRAALRRSVSPVTVLVLTLVGCSGQDAQSNPFSAQTAKLGDAAALLPPPGLNPACQAYGASVLVLPDASLDSVHVDASLCTQGEINKALLYATLSVVGTHAAVWTK